MNLTLEAYPLLMLGNLSDGEKEMMAVILYDLNIELKELGYEVPKH